MVVGFFGGVDKKYEEFDHYLYQKVSNKQMDSWVYNKQTIKARHLKTDMYQLYIHQYHRNGNKKAVVM